MTRDMIKKKKQGFSFMLQKCKIWHFLKITVLTFFIISPVIFGLQRCTLSQIKALEILFWPCFIIFSPRINICWAIMSRSCIIFFTQSLHVFIYFQVVSNTHASRGAQVQCLWFVIAKLIVTYLETRKWLLYVET